MCVCWLWPANIHFMGNLISNWLQKCSNDVSSAVVYNVVRVRGCSWSLVMGDASQWRHSDGVINHFTHNNVQLIIVSFKNRITSKTKTVPYIEIPVEHLPSDNASRQRPKTKKQFFPFSFSFLSAAQIIMSRPHQIASSEDEERQRSLLLSLMGWCISVHSTSLYLSHPQSSTLPTVGHDKPFRFELNRTLNHICHQSKIIRF